MPVGLDFSITAVGLDGAVDRLAGVEGRLQNIAPVGRRVFSELEAGERRHFERLNGRYVDTGLTRDSLTQSGHENAIREAHHDELEFGTSVWYARFLRKKKKSAVLVLQPKARRGVSATILAYVAEGQL